MTHQAHVQALTEKHAALEESINEEANRPHPDTIRLAKLKREKLKLKEEIDRFEQEAPSG